MTSSTGADLPVPDPRLAILNEAIGYALDDDGGERTPSARVLLDRLDVGDPMRQPMWVSAIPPLTTTDGTVLFEGAKGYWRWPSPGGRA